MKPGEGFPMIAALAAMLLAFAAMALGERKRMFRICMIHII
ncbi:MAG: hypothetical protein ACLPX1_05705 [Steroidobacteraceae bacterium]